MKNVVLLGIGVVALNSISAYAGIMGAKATQSIHPSGFVIGGDIGYGFLSTQEFQFVAPLPPAIGTTSQSIGHFIWGVHGGYDVPVLEHVIAGVELGYKDLGQSSYVDNQAYPSNYLNNTGNEEKVNYSTTFTQQAVDFLVTSRIYILNDLNIFGKVGVASVRSKSNIQYSQLYTPSANPASLEVNQSITANPVIWRIRPELALGVGYSFKNSMDVHVMYTYINGSDANGLISIANQSSGLGYAGYQSQLPVIPIGTFTYNAVSVGLSYYFG